MRPSQTLADQLVCLLTVFTIAAQPLRHRQENTSLHSTPVISLPEPMRKSRRSARLSAARPGEASTSRASCSTPEVENLPCDHFQAHMQKLSKDRLTKSQPQEGHTRVLRSSSRANLPYKKSPVACVSTSATKSTRSPVLAKRVCERNAGRDAVDMRQRKHEDSGNTDVKTDGRGVFQGPKRKNQVSSSKAVTKNCASSVNIYRNARSPAGQVSTPADKLATVNAIDLDFCNKYEARREARRIIQAMGKQISFPEYPKWNLNWSCSLMTHGTNVLPPGWLCWSPANM